MQVKEKKDVLLYFNTVYSIVRYRWEVRGVGKEWRCLWKGEGSISYNKQQVVKL